MALLDGLTAIDWSRLHHAYGPAGGVPDLLRALAGPDAATPEIAGEAQRRGRSVREHVGWTLYGNVFHQGSVWQVTATVVPFLYEILTAGPDDDDLRAFLVEYLHHLAMGYPTDCFPGPFDPDTFFACVDGRQDPGGEPDYSDDLAGMVWMRDSYEAVERGIDHIVPFMRSEHEATALQALALAASFPRCAGKTVPSLVDVARYGAEPRAAAALVSLSQIDSSAVLDTADRMLGAANLDLAVQAACALALADPSAVPVAAVRLLSRPLDDFEDDGQVHARSLEWLIASANERIADSCRERAIEDLERQWISARADDRIAVLAELLGVAFRWKPVPERAEELTPSQRRALQWIRDGLAVSDAVEARAAYASLLEDWGLPKQPASG